MNSTRKKIAAALYIKGPNLAAYQEEELDALEAIVREAVKDRFNEAAEMFESDGEATAAGRVVGMRLRLLGSAGTPLTKEEHAKALELAEKYGPGGEDK